jgi:hypothetical protein
MDNEKLSQKKGGFADKVGQAVEDIGTAVGKVTPGLGKKIRDAGDRMEKTHKNPNHPEDSSI